MKVYTTEPTQFGTKILVLNEEVTFDKTGCAEVEDNLGQEMIDYSYMFNAERVKFVEANTPPKVNKVEEGLKDEEIERLSLKIEKLLKQDEARKTKHSLLEAENGDIRKDMQKVIYERDQLKEVQVNIDNAHEKENEVWKNKFELALLEIDELKNTCKEMGLEEKDYAKKKNKKLLIDLIIKATE